MVPFGDAVAIVPDDAIFFRVLGLYVGGAGNVIVETEGGTTVTFTAVPVGTVLPIRIKRLRAGTTATNILGFR
jgi:hypothetical protein